MNFEDFKAAAREMEVNVENFEFGKLQVYFEFLVSENQKMNLTALTAPDDVFSLHFLDSLAAVRLIPKNASVCDVGTGAGFPGVVLKIFRPDIKLTLMDSLNKRINFLKELTAKLDAPAECIHTRAEDAARGEHREKFDFVTSRAVAKLNTLYEYTLPLVKVGGLFVAYKADCAEEMQASENVPGLLGAKLQPPISFTLPVAGAKRTLVIAKKTAPTPEIFPRGKNKERLEPLR